MALPDWFINDRLGELNHSLDGEKRYWHLYIKKTGSKCELRIPKKRVDDVSKYLIMSETKELEDYIPLIRIKGKNKEILRKK